MTIHGSFLVAVVVLSLPILVLSQTNYTQQIYDHFGVANGQSTFLSTKNITELASTIVSGRHFDAHASVCSNDTCPEESCVSPAVDDKSLFSLQDFAQLCPRIIFSLTQDCLQTDVVSDEHEKVKNGEKPPPASVWGFGLLFVTLINLCSLAGVFVLPLMKTEFYSTLLMFLIALAVGSLTANGILVLIPEAFEINEMEGFKWKACTIVGGIYLFFVTERILKMITDYYMKKRHESMERKCDDIAGSIPTHTYKDIDLPMELPTSVCCQDVNVEVSTHALLKKEESADAKIDQSAQGNGDVQTKEKENSCNKPVATVAWMIIFGDGFHNFIDGLSIGAAFSDSILLGVSICIAVLCEELPHELGDFAILLNSGMCKKKALLFNFLSACTCYLGLIIGITLSEVAYATPWILGLSGGMFLYISLADMMPEMNKAAEEHKDQAVKVFIVQNLGFLTGFGIILVISHFGGQISIK